MINLKKLGLFTLASMSLFSLISCGENENNDEKKNEEETKDVVDDKKDNEVKDVDINDINVLFTTDVHCGIEDNVGYSSFKAFKNDLSSKNKYVTTIDAGDAIQGDFVGAISSGSYIVDIMNEVGYDIWTVGNHEFDYGMDTLKNCFDKFNGDVLSCNIKYEGSNVNKLSKVKPYKIIEYGDRSVGYVGVTTPATTTSSNPSSFKENGELVYNFYGDTNEFYNCIQSNIDECKQKGADYIVLVAHVGYGDECTPWDITGVINHTKNVTAVIDGHTHKDISSIYEEDLDGKMVPICEAGTKLKEFGHLIITPSGNVEIGYVTKYDKKDTGVDNLIKNINKSLEDMAKEVVAHSNIALSCSDGNGIRMVRNRETAIGNLVADAYRVVGNTDIGFINGGGIRADLPSGDITFKDVKGVHPFGNTICSIKATGQKIADYLEFCSRFTQADYKANGEAIGESGAFANASGLKYTIDTSIQSTVEVESGSNNFVRVAGERRVKNIMVLNGDTYEPLDLNKTYTVTSHNFLLLSGGDGANMFMDCEIISTGQLADYQVLADYLKNNLNGDIATKYSSIEGRITVL